jgi:hypothetical protein
MSLPMVTRLLSCSRLRAAVVLNGACQKEGPREDELDHDGYG